MASRVARDHIIVVIIVGIVLISHHGDFASDGWGCFCSFYAFVKCEEDGSEAFFDGLHDTSRRDAVVCLRQTGKCLCRNLAKSVGLSRRAT